MPFVVKAHVDDLALTVNANTAKEAFAKAVEWHVVNGFGGARSVTATNASRSPNFHGRWHRKRLRTRSPPSGGHRFLVDVAISHRARVNRAGLRLSTLAMEIDERLMDLFIGPRFFSAGWKLGSSRPSSVRIAAIKQELPK